jgi:plasmid maintenance system antidote protein VapI
LRLARYFGFTFVFWMNLQSAYDLEVVERKSLTAIAREVRRVIAIIENT